MAETTHAAETLSGFSGGRQANRVSLPGGGSAEFPGPVKKAAAKKTTASAAKPAKKTAAKTQAKPTK